MPHPTGLSSSPARNPRRSSSSSPYRRHFLAIGRHALFPFYSLSTSYWNTFASALSTRDKAGNITDQNHSSVGLTFHLVSFHNNLVGVSLVCMRKGPFSVLCCPPFTPVEPEDRDPFLIQIYFSNAQVSSWHIEVASVRNGVWLYITGTPPTFPNIIKSNNESFLPHRDLVQK